MRLTTCATLLLAGVSTAAAQTPTPSRAQLVLTILGGAVSGHSLWDVPIQPLPVIDNQTGQPTAVDDTVHLRRDISSSIVVGASATYFPSSHLGIHAEISYLGLPFDDSCTGIFHTDSLQKNRRACDEVQSHSGAGGSVSLFVGATLRTTVSGGLTPYVRANVGIVGQPHSSVEVVGHYLTAFGPQPVPMINDPSPRRSAPMVGLAFGLTTPIAKDGGYQFRLEARDVITSLERVTGQANAILVPPVASRTYHHLSLTIGLDVVLEKQRGRRY